MSTREQPGYPASRRTGQGQPVLPRRQHAAEQERLRRLQQQTNTDEDTLNEE